MPWDSIGHHRTRTTHGPEFMFAETQHLLIKKTSRKQFHELAKHPLGITRQRSKNNFPLARFLTADDNFSRSIKLSSMISHAAQTKLANFWASYGIFEARSRGPRGPSGQFLKYSRNVENAQVTPGAPKRFTDLHGHQKNIPKGRAGLV